MSTTDAEFFSEIKKCLALRDKPDPQEAAVAMGRAQELTCQHDACAQKIGESIIDSQTITTTTDQVANWELSLVSMVSKAFGCQMLFRKVVYSTEGGSQTTAGQFIFIGQQARPEIAAYTAEMLAKKCKFTQENWIEKNSEFIRLAGGNQSTISSMSNAFSEGWVRAVGRLVRDLSNTPDTEKAIADTARNRIAKGVTEHIARQVVNAGESKKLIDRIGFYAANGESLYCLMTSEKENLKLA